jgi:hypothetical protein
MVSPERTADGSFGLSKYLRIIWDESKIRPGCRKDKVEDRASGSVLRVRPKQKFTL